MLPVKFRPKTNVLGSSVFLGLVVWWMTSFEGSMSTGLDVDATSGCMLIHLKAVCSAGMTCEDEGEGRVALRALPHRGRTCRSMFTRGMVYDGKYTLSERKYITEKNSSYGIMLYLCIYRKKESWEIQWFVVWESGRYKIGIHPRQRKCCTLFQFR